MKYLILLALVLISFKSNAETEESLPNLGKDCRYIIHKASKINPDKIQFIVRLALRSCAEMPNRESVLLKLESTKDAPTSTKYGLFNRLSARMLVYIESYMLRKDLEDLSLHSSSGLNWYLGIPPLHADLNTVATIIGIRPFKYIEVHELTKFRGIREPNILTVLTDLSRFLNDRTYNNL